MVVDGATRGVPAAEAMLAAGEYVAARQAFEALPASDSTASVGLATACRALGDNAAAIAARENAYRLHVAAGDAEAAAVDAWYLADVCADQGTVSVAKGWLARAGHHLAGTAEGPAHVHVSGLEAYLALAYDKDPRAAQRHALESVRIAERIGEKGQALIGQAYLGLIEVSLGSVQRGMRRLEATAAAAAAGELPPLEALDAYCLLITACDRVRDVDRVREWSEKVLPLAEEHGSETFSAFARVQYANGLLLRGQWGAADRELGLVVHGGEQHPVTAAMALVLLSKLRRCQGRLEDADVALRMAEREPYRRAVRHLVVASRAAWELASGRADPAADLTERYLRMVSPSDLIERVDALEILVRARLDLDDVDRARAAVDELTTIATHIGTPGVRGAALSAQGRLLLLEYPEAAVHPLECAVVEYERADLAYDVLDAKVALAAALRRAGRPEAARREGESALYASERLGAEGIAQTAAHVLAPLRVTMSADVLTPREVEVLKLVGAGLANAEIAKALTLSVRTVERHVSNIYLKVGASGPAARSIAIAHGHRKGLI